MAKARARPTRCCMPPESSWANLSANLSSRTSFSFSSTIRSRSTLGTPRTSRPKATLSRTVSHGISANCWNTMEIRLRRSWRRVSALQLATSTSSLPVWTMTLPRVTVLSPLMQRSSEDLPEPERPMSTSISPSLTNSEASCTATRLSVFSRMVSRPSPMSSMASAAWVLRPKITSTCSKRTALRAAASVPFAIALSAMGVSPWPGAVRACAPAAW